MLIGAAPPFLVDTAQIVAAFVTIVGGAAILSRLKPIRWLWRRNVSEPTSAWGKKMIADGAGSVVQRWHDEHVEPILTDLSEKVDRASAWVEVLAEREGLPVAEDPRTLRQVAQGVDYTSKSSAQASTSISDNGAL